MSSARRPAARSARPTPPVTARRIALEALVEIEQAGRANVVVPRLLARSGLQQRDRNLVTELVYGTCRMRRACDWVAAPYLRGPIDHQVRCAVRLGVYQLLWTRIPPHAAVAATVEEVRGRGRSVANAVLRRCAEQVEARRVTWPDPATELSYPDWIVERLSKDLGPLDARAALETMNLPASMTVREDGYVQDRASQMVAAHLSQFTRAGGRVLDVCAAPGGKATGLAGADPKVVVAADVSLSRARTIAVNAARVGAPAILVAVADGTAPPWAPSSFDTVLVDAPCSGVGVLRRRPDARWRIRPGDIPRLAELQRSLLAASIPLVRPGGLLAYSVCTLSSEETAGIDNWLAANAPGLQPLQPPGSPWRPAGRGALLLPQEEGTDGMFMVVLRNTRAPGEGGR